jgi:hypothetical protein
MRNMPTKFWLESLKGRHQSEELGADGKIILKIYLREIGLERVDSCGSGQGTVAGSYGYGNETTGFIRGS